LPLQRPRSPKVTSPPSPLAAPLALRPIVSGEQSPRPKGAGPVTSSHTTRGKPWLSRLRQTSLANGQEKQISEQLNGVDAVPLSYDLASVLRSLVVYSKSEI
jgi:hypothetical protein